MIMAKKIINRKVHSSLEPNGRPCTESPEKKSPLFLRADVNNLPDSSCSSLSESDENNRTNFVLDFDSGKSSTSSEELDATSKPHKSNNVRWEAVKSLRTKRRYLSLEDFNILQRVGSGDIGTVYVARLKGTECVFAIKAMSKSELSARNKVLRVQTERQILETLDHPFLPTLYGHFETKNYSCLVMEFCSGGDLHSLRMKQLGKRFDEDATRFYAAEALVALEYLHMMGVIYRDLKPENVLICEDGHIMLTDFDLSFKCDVSPSLLKSTKSAHQLYLRKFQSFTCLSPGRNTDEANSMQSFCTGQASPKRQANSSYKLLPELVVEPKDARSMSFVGTYEYLAPEMVSGGGHGSAVDWWALGIFIFELLYGKTPFKGTSHDFTLLNVTTQPLQFPTEIGGVSENAKAIMKALLAKDPCKRLGAKRGAAEIKQHPFFAGVNWALIRCTVPPHLPKQFQISGQQDCGVDFELF